MPNWLQQWWCGVTGRHVWRGVTHAEMWRLRVKIDPMGWARPFYCARCGKVVVDA